VIIKIPSIRSPRASRGGRFWGWIARRFFEIAAAVISPL
jgi:hypothetical protein